MFPRREDVIAHTREGWQRRDPMCLIVIAYKQHPAYGLIIAANRDEFYERPAAPLAFWEEAPAILAGRDLKAGGTWLGVSRRGRLAAVTNFRDPAALKTEAPSRGELVTGFLEHSAPSSAYLEGIAASGSLYNGFNLIVYDGKELGYYGNRGGAPRILPPGLYVISNHLLNTPWPKVTRSRNRMRDLLGSDHVSADALFKMMTDTCRPPDEQLPDTGVGMAAERLLSPVFIASPGYGTRNTTLVWWSASGEITLMERAYGPGESPEESIKTRQFSFHITR